jgi:hypothetical protein
MMVREWSRHSRAIMVYGLGACLARAVDLLSP